MTAQENRPSLWATLPVSLRAIIAAIVIALVPANVWPLLLLSVGVSVAGSVEVVFLALYIWWASGGGPPHRTRAAREDKLRQGVMANMLNSFPHGVTLLGQRHFPLIGVF